MSSEAPQSLLPVSIYSNNPEAAPGVFCVGAIECEQLSLSGVAVVLDAARGQLGLRLPCGCEASVSLAGLLLALQANSRARHPGAVPSGMH